MSLDLRSQEQFVESEISAIQAALPGQFQFTLGSIVRAIVEAHGRTAIWEESLVQFVLANTRLSTSTGAACDTFVADYGFKRQQGTAATGTVTFASYADTTQRLIPAVTTGTQNVAVVSTPDNAVQFTVQIDTSNPAYNATLGAYVLAPGTPSIDVPVQANTTGSVGNVQAAQISVITSAIVGIDTVTNADAFTNALDPWSDAKLRSEFVLYLQSLVRATQGALDFAIQSVNGVVNYNLVENIDYNTGSPLLGQFWVVIDDGTGMPSDALVLSVLNAVTGYRGYTIQAAVYKPTILNPTVAATVNFPTGYTSASFPSLISDIKAALQLYVNFIPFGGTFFYTRIGQIIYNVIIATVPQSLWDQFNVTNILLDGATADLTATNKQEFILTSGNTTITPIPS